MAAVGRLQGGKARTVLAIACALILAIGAEDPAPEVSAHTG
jgi:hypothetical protein